MQQNIPAVLQVMQYIYDNIMYAELNTKSDYCQCCGYDGEIKIVENADGKLIWQCPNCGNTDQDKMNVARRTCGYIGTQYWNQGRTQEIKDRSCTYKMNYAEIKKNDIANGEGVRTSLFVSGCRNRCKNCFNAVTWDFLYGKPFDQAVEDDIIASTRPRWISGLSLLGGEPFEPENQAPLLAFLRRFRTALPGKTVWCYTGFTLEELLAKAANAAPAPPIPGSCWD